jgi:hypothetical protein
MTGMANGERALRGGWQTDVHEVGGVVLRSPGPQSPTVIELLKHLERAGFEAAPKPVFTGFAPDGREALEFIEGESPHPLAWSDDATWRIGQLLAELHCATASFAPTEPPRWRPWFGRDLPGEHPVIGHGDLGPWNILARDGAPIAFIDWDNAGPVDAVWELAQVAWHNAQLYDDDVAERNNLPDPPSRAHQVRLILDGYGLAATERDGFVDKLVEIAARSARQEAIDYNVTPDSVATAPDGFPIMWAVTWRTRSVAWIFQHRTLLTNAIAVRK